LQRISIARALCIQPKVLLADEPISMLDVSVRLGVLNLLRGLCENDRLAILLHHARYCLGALHRGLDHRDVRRASRRAVSGTTLVDEPTHPYTQLLIASVPDPSDTAKEAPADR